MWAEDKSVVFGGIESSGDIQLLFLQQWINRPMAIAIDALLEQHLSPQWRGLLRAFATEFESQLNHHELRQLMFRVGERFAGEHVFPPCESTTDLAGALNAQWARIHWGCVELSDEGKYLRILHSGAPLVAFGVNALAWAPAFLEGCYQAWLDAMGASQLSVVQVSTPEGNFSFEFHLARQTA